MPTTITISLGTSSNGTTNVSKQDSVNFQNNTGGPTTVTTPQGLNPQGSTPIATGATSRSFSISANPGASLSYGWTVPDSPDAATRGGTIKVDP